MLLAVNNPSGRDVNDVQLLNTFRKVVANVFLENKPAGTDSIPEEAKISFVVFTPVNGAKSPSGTLLRLVQP